MVGITRYFRIGGFGGIRTLLLLVLLLLALSACSSDGSNGGDNEVVDNKAVTCTSTGDDSTQNPDGSASFVRSYTIAPNTFHSVTSRKDSLNQHITVNYMVHEPAGTPKGMVVLIAGGALTGYLSGIEGNMATGSGGNFLVRSAHRFMAAGYRVITMDRPSDFTSYGDIDNTSYLYDAYRISVDHAIDITTLVNQENADNLPVFIAGTSRGAISAVAQNSLATAIAISSPVTRSSAGGAPIGSTALPIDVVQVPVHVLYHQDDGCGGTQPANTATLLDQLSNASVNVAGNNVSGGFNDTVDNNPCGAFSYHGFLGIENCAVNTTTAWADELLDSMELANPGNARPVAQGQDLFVTGSNSLVISLNATDADDEVNSLTYKLPYSQTSLGGSVNLSGNTVQYIPPALTMETMDSFVFTVIDSKGSRSAAVVYISNIIAMPLDHNLVTAQACSTCHNDTNNNGKSPTHPVTTNNCQACHTTANWIPFVMPFPHNETTDACETCHNDLVATGKGGSHVITTEACDNCHTTNNWLEVPFDHDTVAGQACASAGCHDGVSPRTYKSAAHPVTSDICSDCHALPDWLPIIEP